MTICILRSGTPIESHAALTAPLGWPDRLQYFRLEDDNAQL